MTTDRVVHHHKVQFYETDLMGIVHHSNYLRFFEEARVAWAVHRGILDYQKPEGASHLAVLETWVRHIKPAKFGDELTVHVQAKIDKIKIIFEYKLFCLATSDQPISECKTVHVALDTNLRPIKPPQPLRSVLEKEKWIETWLSN